MSTKKQEALRIIENTVNRLAAAGHLSFSELVKSAWTWRGSQQEDWGDFFDYMRRFFSHSKMFREDVLNSESFKKIKSYYELSILPLQNADITKMTTRDLTQLRNNLSDLASDEKLIGIMSLSDAISCLSDILSTRSMTMADSSEDVDESVRVRPQAIMSDSDFIVDRVKPVLLEFEQYFDKMAEKEDDRINSILLSLPSKYTYITKLEKQRRSILSESASEREALAQRIKQKTGLSVGDYYKDFLKNFNQEFSDFKKTIEGVSPSSSPDDDI